MGERKDDLRHRQRLEIVERDRKGESVSKKRRKREKEEL